MGRPRPAPSSADNAPSPHACALRPRRHRLLPAPPLCGQTTNSPPLYSAGADRACAAPSLSRCLLRSWARRDELSPSTDPTGCPAGRGGCARIPVPASPPFGVVPTSQSAEAPLPYVVFLCRTLAARPCCEGRRSCVRGRNAALPCGALAVGCALGALPSPRCGKSPPGFAVAPSGAASGERAFCLLGSGGGAGGWSLLGNIKCKGAVRWLESSCFGYDIRYLLGFDFF